MSKTPKAAQNPLILILLGWLVPGAGYLLLDRNHWRRGLLFMVVIHLTFIFGILLHGGVLTMSWNMRDPSFSIVNGLTFVIQLGAGWMAWISLLAYSAGWEWLAANDSHAYYELGSFYCLVAGALNYFVVCHSLDRSRKHAFEMIEE
ncbi:MAG: DUF6677 family protein [Candidatus Sumerlaeia bacterium]